CGPGPSQSPPLATAAAAPAPACARASGGGGRGRRARTGAATARQRTVLRGAAQVRRPAARRLGPRGGPRLTVVDASVCQNIYMRLPTRVAFWLGFGIAIPAAGILLSRARRWLTASAALSAPVPNRRSDLDRRSGQERRGVHDRRERRSEVVERVGVARNRRQVHGRRSDAERRSGRDRRRAIDEV